MRKTVLSLLLTIICSTYSFAYDAYINGIYYNLDAETKNATVTYYADGATNNKNAYTGKINIPQRVSYSGVSYTVSKIGYNAFCGCSGVTSISIPSTIQDIDFKYSSPFFKCSSLTSFSVDSSNGKYKVIDNILYEYYDKLIACPAGRTGTVVVNSSTKTIGNYAFESCTKLTSVDLASCTTVREGGFWGCTSLSNIKMPKVYKIEIEAFNNTPFLTNAINYTSNNSVIYVGNVAYKVKGTPTSVMLKEGTLGIAPQAFENTNIESITLPNSLIFIAHYAFNGCYRLSNCVVSGQNSQLEVIDSRAFANCTMLNSFTIPVKCKNIGIGALSGCTKLTHLYSFPETPPTASRVDEIYHYMLSAFDDNVSNVTLYVPFISYRAKWYQKTPPWNAFGKYEYIPGTIVENTEPQLVDLGLPSGTLWANKNLGAYIEEDYGEYYAWACVNPDANLDSKLNITDYRFIKDEDNAAKVLLGSYWDIPTAKQEQELIDCCQWKWTQKNSINGFEIVGPNGNKIFLPASGWINSDNKVWGEGEAARFWSKNRGKTLDYYDKRKDFTSGWAKGSIRPVITPYETIRLPGWLNHKFYAEENDIVKVDLRTAETKYTVYLDGKPFGIADDEDVWGLTARVEFTGEHIVDFVEEIGSSDGSIGEETYLIKTSPTRIMDACTCFNRDRTNEVLEFSYTRTFSNTSWQALYVPFSMSYDDWKDDFEVAYINNVNQYDDDEDGTIDRTVMEVIKMKEGKSIKPNTPYLIKAKTTGEKTITLEDATLYKTEETTYSVTSWFNSFNFVGTYHTISDMTTKGYYAMAGGALKKATSNAATLQPFRWYLSVTDRNGNPVSLNSKSMSIVFDDGEATGIETINNETKKSTSIHTLTGISKGNDMKVLAPGIYIKNGKKFIVK